MFTESHVFTETHVSNVVLRQDRDKTGICISIHFNIENMLKTAAHCIFLRTETVYPAELKYNIFSVISDIVLFNI